MIKEMICFLCPNSCELNVTVLNQKISVDNNKCSRGIVFAKKEIEDPERILTTSVLVVGGKSPLVSVRTKTPVKKDEIRDIMKYINNTKVSAPVSIGQVLLLEIGINKVEIIATRNVEKGS